MRYLAFFSSILTTTLLAGLFVGLSTPLSAQRLIDSVEVLVNDEPITTIDITHRLQLVAAISGGIRSQEEFLKVREQVIQAMIDERLQLQEAAESASFVVEQDQLNEFFQRRAQGAGQSPEQFEQALASIGSSRATMVKQMEAEYVWSELVRGRLGPLVNVSDDEVANYINRIVSNRGKAEYRVSEIVLLINSPAQEASVQANATQLVARLRDGSDFSQIAQQLSASPSAARGGELGWVTEDTLSENQVAALQSLQTGDISDPVRTAGGYQILRLMDKRRVLTAEAIDDTVDLRHLFIPPAMVANAEILTRYREGVKALQARGNLSCDSFDSYAEEIGAAANTQIGQATIRTLQGESRTVVNALPVGVLADPVDLSGALHAFFVCERTKGEVEEPDYDQVLNQLEQQRLAMMGRRFLRDLRRKAIVDYR